MNYYKIINTNGVDLGNNCMTKIISEEEIVKIENYYFLDIELVKLNEFNQPQKKEEKRRVLN